MGSMTILILFVPKLERGPMISVSEFWANFNSSANTLNAIYLLYLLTAEGIGFGFVAYAHYYNSTWGTASLLLWNAGATAQEGQGGAEVTPRGQGATESQSHGAWAFTLGAERNSLCLRKEDVPSE